MGKKGSWFSAIKRVFTHSSKEKPTNGPDNRNSKEKKKGKGVLRHSETKSFIPLFREPSSIEKILGEADEILTRPPAFSDDPKAPAPLLERPTPQTAASPRIASNAASSPKAKVSSPRAASPKPRSPRVTSPKPVFPKNDSLEADPPRIFSPGAASSKAAAPKVMQSRKEVSYVQRPDPTLRHRHLSATKIQAAYRGYVARRSFRALRGLVRLQGVVRGQNVKRQTINAMKQMQLLVRVQTQIQSRRIQMLENQALENQAHKIDKEMESTLSKWTQLTEAGSDGWDDSSLTKEELEARMQKKVEAVIKRERAMAYAYSHQLWKSNPKSVQSSLDIRSNGYPWWWNWLERQLPPTSTSQSHKNINITPPRPISEYKPSPRPHASNYPTPNNFTFDNNEALTPRSSKSSVPVRSKPLQTPGRTPSPGFMKNSKTRASAANSAYDAPLKDDDSLMSCPPFSAPNYMTPTVSAKAKVRANSNPKERLLGTPSNDSKRRFSFPLTPNIGSFKWSKGSNKDSSSQKVLESQKSPRSIGNMSIDSAVSMPSLVGRKPFNRFV